MEETDLKRVLLLLLALLMLAPAEVLDSVVVHELCHRKEMNHSPRFYALIQSVFPEYRQCAAWLKTNGPLLQARLAAGREELSADTED